MGSSSSKNIGSGRHQNKSVNYSKSCFLTELGSQPDQFDRKTINEISKKCVTPGTTVENFSMNEVYVSTKANIYIIIFIIILIIVGIYFYKKRN